MAQIVQKEAVTPATITITVDGESRDIFMSFGLVDELTRLVAGSPDLIPQIEFDPEMRETVLIAVLAKRKKSGKLESALDSIDDVDISIEDIERLLAWTTDHLMGFLMRSVQRVTELTERNKAKMKELEERVSSSNGSKGSPSKSPSDGPSTEPQAS